MKKKGMSRKRMKRRRRKEVLVETRKEVLVEKKKVVVVAKKRKWCNEPATQLEHTGSTICRDHVRYQYFAGYTGPNLKRHLTRVHVKKGHIVFADVDRYFNMGVRGKKKRGPA